jgi:hypothetical protein
MLTLIAVGVVVLCVVLIVLVLARALVTLWIE